MQKCSRLAVPRHLQVALGLAKASGLTWIAAYWAGVCLRRKRRKQTVSRRMRRRRMFGERRRGTIDAY